MGGDPRRRRVFSGEYACKNGDCTAFSGAQTGGMVGAWGDKAAQRMSAGQVRSDAGAGARDLWSVERRRGRDALAVARR